MDQPSPTNAQRFAESAVSITRNVTGIELDFSPSSLEQVDSLICGFQAQGFTADTMNETICLFGCYVGEVVIRNHGGQWKAAGDTGFRDVAPPDLLVLETPNKAVWNPIGKAFKLLANGMEDSLAFFMALRRPNCPRLYRMLLSNEEPQHAARLQTTCNRLRIIHLWNFKRCKPLLPPIPQPLSLQCRLSLRKALQHARTH